MQTSQSLGWKGINVIHLQKPAGFSSEHYHSQHEIVVPDLRHIANYKTDGQKSQIRIDSGTSTIVPANVPHQVRWDRDVTLTVMMLDPNSLAQIASETFHRDNVEIVTEYGKSDILIQGIALSLQSELYSQELDNHLYIDSLINTLSIHLLKNYATFKPTLREYRDGLPKYKLEQALDYIEAYLDRDIRLEDISQVVGMSKCYFIRLFKQSIGITPYKYLTQIRIEKAKKLLKQKDLPIADITLQCGFTNQSSFTRLFRQTTGTTPGKYRNN